MIVISLVNIFDSLVTPLIPQKYNPNTYLPRDIPGIGLIVLISFLIVVGFLTANFLEDGYKQSELFFQNLPFIKFFYKTIKQILETILSNKSKA